MAAFAVFFIGVSKAGFGGGLGMLTTPVCVLAFGPKDAIGILLPLLCAGDAFSLYHYWGKWERKNLIFLMPGVVVGVMLGVNLVGAFSARQMNVCIGILAVFFVLFQIIKEKVFRMEGAFSPSHRLGIPCGVGAGIISTFAHGAGPLVSLFVIPQQLAKEVYVGTTILIFAWINWIKLPFFAGKHLITSQTLRYSLIFLPLVPVGVLAGVRLNRSFSEKGFMRAVYAITLLTGLQLIFNFNPAGWLK
jgi:uncharacterized membrane protein YfcA